MKQLNYEYLPEHMQGQMRRYMEEGINPGNFLQAILANDLAAASYYADDINKHEFFCYGVFLMNEAPVGSWGNIETTLAWMEKGGMSGIDKAS